MICRDIDRVAQREPSTVLPGMALHIISGVQTQRFKIRTLFRTLEANVEFLPISHRMSCPFGLVGSGERRTLETRQVSDYSQKNPLGFFTYYYHSPE